MLATQHGAMFSLGHGVGTRKPRDVRNVRNLEREQVLAIEDLLLKRVELRTRLFKPRAKFNVGANAKTIISLGVFKTLGDSVVARPLVGGDIELAVKTLQFVRRRTVHEEMSLRR